MSVMQQNSAKLKLKSGHNMYGDIEITGDDRVSRLLKEMLK